MKNTIFTFFLLLINYSLYAQQSGCDNNRYFNTVFENVTTTYDVQYGQNITLSGSFMDLKMDIYEPEGDVLEKRPVIVFAHGNGQDRDDLDYLCEDFAQRGFVAATISYRPIDLSLPDSIVGIALTMGFHDMKAAIRYFREDAATLDNYRIDPDFIFAGGISLGAFMANSVGYLDSSDNISPNILALLNALGGLEGNSSSNIQYSSEVQGVLNYSGFIAEAHFIDADDPPLYSFHDEFDPGVPCGYDPLVIPFYGSCEMHAAAEAAGIKNKLYLRSESPYHVGWHYGTILYESAQFLGEILCENAPDSPWEEIGSGLDNPGFLAFDISVVDENIIWNIPFNSKHFSKTTDGGQTWTTGTVTTNNSSFGLVGIQAFDENTAIAMMRSFPDEKSGKMYKTTDGGLSWTEQSTSFVNPNEGPRYFHFFDENDGFALGHLIDPDNSSFSSHVGYVTSDGGTTWEKLGTDVYPAAPGERIFAYDTKFLEARGDHLWFGTRIGQMYHSSDRGKTWEVHEVASLMAIHSVAFKDELNGIAVSANDAFNTDLIKTFSTSDGGQTWTELSVPPLPRTTGIYFVEGSAEGSNSCGTYFIFSRYRDLSGTSISKDGGQTWELISQQPVNDIEFITPELGWMGSMIHGADKGGLYKWDGESLESSDGCTTPTKEVIVESHDLTIYPNPVSNITNIRLENDWKGTLNLKIINTLGQMIHFEELEKHNNTTVWALDLNKLNPGAYQLVLSNGQKIKVKPIVKF